MRPRWRPAFELNEYSPRVLLAMYSRPGARRNLVAHLWSLLRMWKADPEGVCAGLGTAILEAIKSDDLALLRGMLLKALRDAIREVRSR